LTNNSFSLLFSAQTIKQAKGQSPNSNKVLGGYKEQFMYQNTGAYPLGFLYLPMSKYP